MSNYISISGPMSYGLKPKSFFAETKDLYRSRLMYSESGIKARLSKYTSPGKSKEVNPYTRELAIMAPWIIAGAALLMSLL